MSTVGNYRGPNIVKDGLVLYLDAATSNSYNRYISPTTWKDISGNGNTGTLVGPNGLPSYSSANGGSIVFDGTDDYILYDKQISLVNTNKFTMCSWMKRNLSNSLVIIGQIETLTNDVTFELWSDGNAYFEVGNGSNSFGFVSNTSTSWQYLSMSFDGTQTGNSNRLKAYINGVLQILTYNLTIPSSTGTVNTNLNIGAYLPGNNYSNGNISNVQIYNRALSSTEILQNYNATRARFGI